MKTIAIALIKLYKLTISPLLGTNCRFIPSCSTYAIKAITKYGFFIGSWMGIKRIVRCNPWNSHFGHDDVL